MAVVTSYYIPLKNDAPIVAGNPMTFTVTIVSSFGKRFLFLFHLEDNWIGKDGLSQPERTALCSDDQISSTDVASLSTAHRGLCRFVSRDTYHVHDGMTMRHCVKAITLSSYGRRRESRAVTQWIKPCYYLPRHPRDH